MRRSFAVLFCLLAAPLLRAETIKVGAAISLKEAITEIAKTYEAESGEHVEFTFGSSGQLMAQIKAGAPVDAFISAASKQVDELDAAGLIDRPSRRVLAGNTLVLIVPAGSGVALSRFEQLADPGIGKVSMGDPKSVPAGQYAQQVIKKLGIDQKLQDRVIYGTNVRQVLDYVERGEVVAGIVYATDAREGGEKVKVVAKADPSMHEPIQYPAVVVSASKKGEATKRFLDYAKSEKAQAILKRYGFTSGVPKQ